MRTTSLSRKLNLAERLPDLQGTWVLTEADHVAVPLPEHLVKIFRRREVTGSVYRGSCAIRAQRGT